MDMLKRFLPFLLCLPIALAAQVSPIAKVTIDQPQAAAKTPSKAAPKTAPKPGVELPPRAAGSKDAPIVLEVFSDFSCPGCKNLYLLTLRRTIEDYCDKGKVYMIHHDFPLPMHPHSRTAAKWAIAAATIGKYEAVTEALFTKQDNWSANGNIEPVIAAVLTPADLKKVKDTMNARANEIDAAIDSDMALGQQLKVVETPSVKVTNKGTVVAPMAPAKFTFAVLKRFLDDQLTK
jgi:protein-disulfide isomerase